jgi:hypothetical protein
MANADHPYPLTYAHANEAGLSRVKIRSAIAIAGCSPADSWRATTIRDILVRQCAARRVFSQVVTGFRPDRTIRKIRFVLEFPLLTSAERDSPETSNP